MGLAHQPKTGIFTTEMNEDDLRNRLVTHTGMPLFKVEHPHLMTPQERAAYELALAEIGEWPLEVIYDSNISATTIEETTYNREYDFVILDHTHDLEWGDRRALESEIRKLASLARDYNIPVMILAQLRKNERGRDAKPYSKPSLQDFRETSQFENASSLCLAIWRERADDGHRYNPNGTSHLLVLKNRYGRSGYGSVLRFDGPTQRFLGGNDDDNKADDNTFAQAGGFSSAQVHRGSDPLAEWLGS
jgi:replicative DNA helicase